MLHRTRVIFTSCLCMWFAVISIGFVGGEDDNLADGSGACVMDLIWPPSDAITLIASDSQLVVVYLKLSGNCSQFVKTSPRGSGLRHILEFSHNSYLNGIDRHTSFLAPALASPLSEDLTPVHFRLLRSPLLALGERKGPLRVVHDFADSKQFSVWFITLTYPDWKNVAMHAPDSLYMAIELHLLSNLSIPVNSLSVPSTTLRLRLFDMPSSHFFSVVPRYTAIPGFVCLSACGTMCALRTESVASAQLLRPFESPVCTPTAHAFKKTVWSLTGPSFTLERTVGHATFSSSNAAAVLIVASSGYRWDQEMLAVGLGRNRLLSVIASVLQNPVDFIFLMTHRTRVDEARLTDIIRNFDLALSDVFIAFHHQSMPAKGFVDGALPGSSQQLPLADFGSIDDGILLSRTAAELMIMAANDHAGLQHRDAQPDACSEFAVFSDAWLCWCAASLEIPALDIRFTASHADDMSGNGGCAASNALFEKLQQLYGQQQVSESQSHDHVPFSHVPPPFTGSATQRYKLFLQKLAFRLVSSLRISDIKDDEASSDALFFDTCFSRVLFDPTMPWLFPPTEPSVALMGDPVGDAGMYVQETEAAKGALISHNHIALLPEPLLDNEHLPLVTSSDQKVIHLNHGLQNAASIAWIVSGVWRDVRSVTTLHHLRDQVCAGLGSGSVHFYFVISNVEEGALAAMSRDRRSEIQKFIQDTLPHGSVMLVVFQESVDHSGWFGRGSATPQFCNFVCSDTWCSRLQIAYNYITATETAQLYRYAFVVHSRTDAQYSGLFAPAQKWHDVISERGIVGSSWKSGRFDWDGGKDDSFFILRRCHAAHALLHFPAFTYRLMKRELVSGSIADRAVWAHTHCWPEAAVSYFFTASQWSTVSMQVMDLCGLGLVGSIKAHMNCGVKIICP